MYPRVVKAPGARGVELEYVRLVEAYREGGRVKQRTVVNLGRRDVLAEHLDAIVAVVRGDKGGRLRLDSGQIEAVGAWDWGPMLVASQLWRELGLETILDRMKGRGRQPKIHGAAVS